MSEVNEVPRGWEIARIEEVSDINPKIPFDEISDDLEVSFLPMKNVEVISNIIYLDEKRQYSEVKKGYTAMTNGDVIFAKITPCMENGKIAVVHSLTNNIAFGSTEFHVFRCSQVVKNSYLFYFLVQERTRQNAAQNMTGAVGQRRVPKTFLETYQIPLPPLPEQHRIVAKIEALFSSLDKGIETLQTAQQQLKVYRQAVLKWAFEGKLSELRLGGLKDDKITVESEKEKSKAPDKKILKSNDPENPNSDKGELPEGWKWGRIDEAANSLDNLRKPVNKVERSNVKVMFHTMEQMVELDGSMTIYLTNH